MANALNPSIILAGQGLDVVGAMDAGAIAGQRANQFKQQNALNGYLQQNGAQVMNGDQNALNALAGFGMDGLNAAQNVQTTRLGMDQARLGMDATRQNMQMATSQEGRLSRQEERQIAEHAATLSATERQAQSEQIRAGIMQGTQLYSSGDLAGLNSMLTQIGREPLQSLDQFPAIAGQYEGVLGIMEGVRDFNAGPDPLDAIQLEQAGLNVEKTQAELNQLNNPTPKPADLAGSEEGLRKEWTGNAAVKDFATQASAYGRIINSSRDDSAAGDLALIFGFMKMLDPGSVVREGEFATAQNAAGIPDRVRNAYNNAIDGTRLNPAQRTEFTNIADNIYSGAEGEYQKLIDQYTSIANRQGINPQNVIIDYRASPRTAAPTGGGGITAATVRAMPAEQAAQYLAETPIDQIPDDVLDALIERGQ
jgi:hypothetical protein